MIKRIFLMSMLWILTMFMSAQTVSKTVNVIAPGSLSNFFTSVESITVTNLTVSGNIDARDFVFMRDKMTSLTVLNLSSAKIKQYIGLSGTYSDLSLIYPANELPMYAFYNDNTTTYKSTLTSITLPTTITSIGYLAFYYCYNLTGTLTIPSTLISIADYALYGCSNISAYSVNSGNTRYASYDGMLLSSALDSIFICPTSKTGSLSLPQTVKFIGYSAFEGCAGLTGTLTLPSSVKTIEDYAFYYCSGFTGNLSIPSAVTKLGSSAFYGCSGLNGTVSIPATVTSLNSTQFLFCDNITAFSVDVSNLKYCSVDGLLYSKSIDTLIVCPASKSGSLSIPASVKVIGPYALYNCKNITGTVTIAQNVDSIGKYAFFGCNQLSSFEVNTSNTKFSVSDGVLFNKLKTKVLACPALKSGQYTIPATVQSIDGGAFSNCKLLTGTLTIPKAVYNIGDYAFYGCSQLSGFDVEKNNPSYSALEGLLFNSSQDSLLICPLSKSGKYVVPSTVKYIGYSAFDGCTLLTEVIVPNSVTSIDNYAFEYCTGLTKIHLAENVSSIGSAAFYNCSSLKIVEIENVIPPKIDFYTFDLIDKTTCNLVVSKGYTSVYKSASYWKEFSVVSESDFLDTGIASRNFKYKYFAQNKVLQLSGLTIGEPIELVSMLGRRVIMSSASSNLMNINVSEGGVYILKISKMTCKIIL